MNIRSGINWTKTVAASAILCTVFGFSAMAQDNPGKEGSVIRWDAISTSNLSFGRMTIYKNRNSKKITWRGGQNSPYILISEDAGGTIIHLTAAPKFDGDKCRYLKMIFNEDIVTVNFYNTKRALDQNRFFMEGSYEQVKSPMKKVKKMRSGLKITTRMDLPSVSRKI